MDFVEIIKSWAISIKPSKEQVEIAEQRLQICSQCPAMIQKPVMRCRVCGCPLRAKVFSPKVNACPQSRWLKPNQNQGNLTKLL